MAASSPAPSTTSTETNTTATATATATATSNPATATSILSPAKAINAITTPTKAINGATTLARDPPKSLRGLNKPKCSKCGNVARSRCPFQSCKSCCAKAQNPCHIHVLKAHPTLPDKAPASSSTLFDKQSTDVSPSGTSLRVSSLRQLSQFNGTQVQIRARRPLTRKDAATINEWRFSQLKEYRDSYIEVENEAFERYMQNVSLLEQAFLVNSLPEGPSLDESPLLNPSTKSEGNVKRMISALKAQLRSNPKRASTFRQKMQNIVDQGLSNLRKLDDDENTEANDLDGAKEFKILKKAKISRVEQISALDDLIDKLNKARNEEELQSCLQIKSQLFNQHEIACSAKNAVAEATEEQIGGNVSTFRQGLEFLLPRLCSTVKINQEALQSIDMYFCSLDQADQIDDL